MLTIAVGIVLAVFLLAVLSGVIEVFGKDILSFAGSVVVLVFAVAAVSIMFYLLSLLPFVKDILGTLIVCAVVAGGIAFAGVAFRDVVFRRMGVWGVAIVALVFVPPPLFAFYVLGGSEWLFVAALTVFWGMMVFWVFGIVVHALAYHRRGDWQRESASETGASPEPHIDTEKFEKPVSAREIAG